MIAEKIAAQVSEDFHVLDKELLTQEVKDILRRRAFPKVFLAVLSL